MGRTLGGGDGLSKEIKGQESSEIGEQLGGDSGRFG